MSLGNKLLMLALGAGAYWAFKTVRAQQRYMGLNGRSVLVTGGSRGLGLVMARQLVREGARVTICARDTDELERARVDLQQLGGSVLAVPCDVSDPDDVAGMIRQVRQWFDRVDVLINNAGVIEVGPVETMTIADFEEAMRINFWGALHTTLAVLPEMQRRRDGRIVNISSIGGKISVPHLIPYSASKFALTGLSEGLRAELAKDNVWVTTVCPHLMRTGSPVNATFKGQNQAEYAWFSISDSLPIISMNAERAARRILTACKYGEAEVILTLQANLAVRLHGLFPNLTAEVMALMNKLLPEPGGIGTERATGKESYSELSPSWLTILNERAGFRNNEQP